ncbi:cation-transporting P-type ATPase [Pseudarthrobacter sp. So.54]
MALTTRHGRGAPSIHELPDPGWSVYSSALIRPRETMTPEAPAEGAGAGTLPGVAGLSSSEAARRLAQAGANKLPEGGAVPAWRRLLAELTHFFAVLLWCASVLAYVAGMPQLAVAIAVVILVNGVFAYIQQERAQHAAAKLRELLPAMVSVRRDGRILKVHTTELVPGDAVVLVAA